MPGYSAEWIARYPPEFVVRSAEIREAFSDLGP